MSLSLDIEHMTKEEKIQAMELIWNDLCTSADTELPDWHASVLAEREQRHANGLDPLTDWQHAKKHIREAAGQ